MDYTEAKGRNLNVQKMLMSCLLAIISTYGLSHLGNQPNNSAATNLLLTSALAIVSSYLFYRTLANKHSRRAVVIAFIFGLLFSLASFIPCIENSLASGLSLQDALVKGMIWSVTFLPLPISLFLLLLDVLDKPIDPSIETSGNKSSFLKNAWQIIISLSAKKYFFIAWLAIMVVWLVGYLGAFPGHYGYDAIFQINWYCNGIITSQHPLLHTYFLGFCIIDLGRNLFGSEMVGLVIYCLTQMLTMSAIFAFVAARMRSTLSNGISFATVLFIALVPYNMILAFSTTKDSLFGAFFLLSLYLTYELSYYRSRPDLWCKRSHGSNPGIAKVPIAGTSRMLPLRWESVN